MKKLAIIMMILSQFYTSWAYAVTPNLIWPTPVVLEEGQPAKEDVYVYTEEQFSQLLWLEGYYKISEKEWEIKEEVYNDALKKAQKKMKTPFWRTYKAGFITGIALFVLAAYAIGQVK